MAEVATVSAPELRTQFRALPKDKRDANQSFSIRLWRALSWLERAQGMPISDLEGKFISTWIGVNALYGRQTEDHQTWGDREALDTFLAHTWKIDHDRQLRRVMGRKELQILKLIENKYLSTRFWQQGEQAGRRVKQELKESMRRYHTPGMRPVLQILMDRLYVMRNQVFHGASTKGSKLNRRTLQGSTTVLMELLPAMILIMIEHGIDEDWGEVCFPPVSS